MDAFDDPSLERVVRALLTNDRHLQRETVDTYCTDDVTLTHFLGVAHGKDAYYGMYRYSTAWIGAPARIVGFQLHDMFFSKGGDKAAIRLDLLATLFYVWSFEVPMVIEVHARREQDGKWRIYEQIDHNSMYLVYTFFGWPGQLLFSELVGPLGGGLISYAGHLADTWELLKEQLWAFFTE